MRPFASRAALAPLNQSGTVILPSAAVVLSIKVAVSASVPAPLPAAPRNDRVENVAGVFRVIVPAVFAESSRRALLTFDCRRVYWTLGLAALTKVVPIGRPLVGEAVLKPL